MLFTFFILIPKPNIWSNVESNLQILVGIEPRDKTVQCRDYKRLEFAIFSTAGSIVYNWSTRPIDRRLYSVIFKDPFDMKYKTFKNRLNS